MGVTMEYIKDQVEKPQMKDNIPEFGPGDTIVVGFNIKEGDKTRIQNFEGLVIARKGAVHRESIKVRKISYGEGVEITFPLHSPRVEYIKVKRRGKVRRAKLYYIREKVGKAARIKEKK